MKKTVKRVSVTQTTETTSQAVEVSMQPTELDAIGRLVITEEQGGIFTPSSDHDIEGFRRKMEVVVRDNGRVVLVPAHRKPSRARELAKTPHGKLSLTSSGDVIITIRFANAIRGEMANCLDEEIGAISQRLSDWELTGF